MDAESRTIRDRLMALSKGRSALSRRYPLAITGKCGFLNSRRNALRNPGTITLPRDLIDVEESISSSR